MKTYLVQEDDSGNIVARRLVKTRQERLEGEGSLTLAEVMDIPYGHFPEPSAEERWTYKWKAWQMWTDGVSLDTVFCVERLEVAIDDVEKTLSEMGDGPTHRAEILTRALAICIASRMRKTREVKQEGWSETETQMAPL